MSKLKPGTQLHNFVIDKLLSEQGGMSHIYQAHDVERPDYPVAVKVGLTQGKMAKAFKDLLLRESQVLAKLHHPTIVHIIPQQFGRNVAYVAKTDDDAPYYAMEYITGPTLDQCTKQIAKRFPFEWAIELFYQIVIGVHYMHQLGYAHCDLKPQNIMLRREPEVHQMPQPVLIDFGAVSPVRLMSELAVSIRYAPPEALKALDRPDMPEYKDIRADKVDIWGLGVILYEIVTGQPLFNQRNENVMRTTILQGKLKSMTDQRDEVHKSMDKLMMQMLKSDPTQRPSTTRIIEALEKRITSVRPPRIAVKL